MVMAKPFPHPAKFLQWEFLAQDRYGSEPHYIPERINATEGALAEAINHRRREKAGVVPIPYLSRR